MEAGIKFKIFSAGGNYTSKDVEILQKSTITIYVISDNTEGDANQYFSSLDEIQNAFKVSYSQYAPGLPIICKGCYTKDHSVFNIYVHRFRVTQEIPMVDGTAVAVQVGIS